MPTSSHDYPMSSYLVKQSGGKLQLAGEQFNIARYGRALLRDNTALRDALMKRLNRVIADGKYAAIIEKYGMKDAGIANVTFNRAVK